MRASKLKGGFTLIELLVVIAIIAILMSLIGVVAFRARERARIVHTKALLKRVTLALDVYKAQYREYPPTATELYPASNPYPGVDFDLRWVTDWVSTDRFGSDDRDPADKNYLVDSWGKRIKFRKVAIDRMLLWSWGRPNDTKVVKDDIGTDTKRRDTIPGSMNITNQDSGY